MSTLHTSDSGITEYFNLFFTIWDVKRSLDLMWESTVTMTIKVTVIVTATATVTDTVKIAVTDKV